MGAIVALRVESDDGDGLASGVFDGMRDVRRKRKPVYRAFRNGHVLDFGTLPVTNQDRPGRHQDFGSMKMVMIASNATRLRDGHVDVLLNSKFFGQDWLKDDASRVVNGREGMSLNHNGEMKRLFLNAVKPAFRVSKSCRRPGLRDNRFLRVVGAKKARLSPGLR
jgi:hypothetical protein